MGYQELIIEPQSADLSEPNIVADTIEQTNDVRVEDVTDEPGIVEKAVHPQVDHSSVEMPDANVAKAMFQQGPGEEAKAGGADKSIYESVSGLAMLTIGLFAVVVIFGVAILARARRV